MKICIPTNHGTGLDDAVCGHFGSASYFTICDTEGGEPEIIVNGNAHHTHGTCQPLSQLADKSFDALVCGGMGRRALETMQNRGFKVYKATDKTVRGTLEAWKAGTLPELDLAHACGGHAHGGGHGSGQCHRHGNR
jgi:predicted Fe-Mo cluster-binding NifX family protein